MQIKEVCALTGLSAKAIRLYESKGLVMADRASNDYRAYTEEQVERLHAIRRFRMAGVSLVDIRLWADGLFDAETLFEKRLRDLTAETDRNKEQERLCREGMKTDFSASDSERSLFDEPELLCPADSEDAHSLSLGIDIGTTTISAAVADMDSHRQVACYTLPNQSTLAASDAHSHEQDAVWIAEKLRQFLRSVLGAFPSIKAIGVTGQMHGIVYIDAEGNAVSPLYTWQDDRAAQAWENGKTYAQTLSDITGYPVMPGYGFATYYYQDIKGLVPEQAVSFCTVCDYAVMRITGRKTPLMHASHAASLGLFDLKRRDFDRAAVEKVGFRRKLSLPEVAQGEAIAGYYETIPVTVAFGDNQAAFFGSVRNEQTDLSVNYGTGSQISLRVEADCSLSRRPLELRPYFEGRFLLNGSALCGGRAYALLEKFVRAVRGESAEQYKLLDHFAEKGLAESRRLSVRTTFCGTRQDPLLRGAIENIGEDNFTPEALTLGVLQGMADELYEMYEKSGVTASGNVVASGNAVQKNPTLCRLLSKTFHLPLVLPALREEAAFGAALAAAHVVLPVSEADVKSCIPYVTENQPKE